MTAHTRSLGRVHVAHRAVSWPDERVSVVMHLAERTREPLERVFAAVYEIVCTYFQPLHTIEEPTPDTLTTAAREAFMLCVEHPLFRNGNVLSLGVTAVCGGHVVVAQLGDCQLARWNGAAIRNYTTKVRVGDDFVVSGTDLAELNLSVRAEQATAVPQPFVRVFQLMPHESLLLYLTDAGSVVPNSTLQPLLQRATRSASRWHLALRETAKAQSISCVLTHRGWREFRPLEWHPVQPPTGDWEELAARGEIPMEWIDDGERVFLDDQLATLTYASGPSNRESLEHVVNAQARMVTAETVARELIPWLIAWGFAAHTRVIWDVVTQRMGEDRWVQDDAIGLDWIWREADGWSARGWWGPLARGLYRLRELGCPMIASSEQGIVLRLEAPVHERV